MSQTSYSTELGKSIAGGFAEQLSNEVQTRIVPAAGASVGYGLAVESLAGGDYRIKPYVGGKVSGVVARDLNNDDQDGEYEALSEVPVLTNGSIWVKVDDDVTPSSAVFVRKAVEAEVFTVTWDADFVTGNTINGSVGGEAIAAVPFDTNHSTTLTNLATAIQNLANVATATVTGARQITITGATAGVSLSPTTNFTVTGGASQAVDTPANVTGPTASATLGIFRADADDVGNGATAVALTSAKFLTTASAGGLAALRVNLP